MTQRLVLTAALCLFASCSAEQNSPIPDAQPEAGTTQDASAGPEADAAVGLDAGPEAALTPEAGPDAPGSDDGAEASGQACGDKSCGPGEDCSSCPADCQPCNTPPPDMYEPFEFVAPDVAERSSTELAQNNGCFSREFGQYHERAMCLATTRPVTDLVSQTTTTRARAGNSCMRFLLKPTPVADWPSGEPTHRNELDPDGSWDYLPPEGEERWYGFSVLFPDDFVFAPAAIASNLRFIIAQWQHGTAGSPSVSFEVMSDKLEVVTNGGTAPDDIHSTHREPIATIERGKWIDLVVRIVWHKTQGAVAVWSNGIKAFEEPALQTVYDNKTNGGKLKLGIYYWRWKNQSDVLAGLDAGITQREVFIDEVREYHGTDGYSVVVPR